MQIAIKSTNIVLTEAISNYVDNKIKPFEKFADSPDTICRVEVGKTSKHHQHGDYFRAEVKVILRGKEYYASSERSDLYSAIDEVRDELFNKVSLQKDKEITRFRRIGAKIKNFIRGIKNKNE